MTVVPLNDRVVVAAPASNPEVVAALESLLEMAKGGELVGFAIAIAHPADLTSWQTGGRQVRAMIGALDLMKYEMCRADSEGRT